MQRQDLRRLLQAEGPRRFHLRKGAKTARTRMARTISAAVNNNNQGGGGTAAHAAAPNGMKHIKDKQAAKHSTTTSVVNLTSTYKQCTPEDRNTAIPFPSSAPITDHRSTLPPDEMRRDPTRRTPPAKSESSKIVKNTSAVAQHTGRKHVHAGFALRSPASNPRPVLVFCPPSEKVPHLHVSPALDTRHGLPPEQRLQG